MGEPRSVWRERVERWRASGQTRAEFASREGVNKKTLSYWAWTFSKEEREREPSTKELALAPSEVAEPATFTEVTPPSSTWWAASERIEIAVGELSVRVPDTFDPRTLRAVLDVLTAAESAE